MKQSKVSILITGANGFIGKALMDYYKKNGEEEDQPSIILYQLLL